MAARDLRGGDLQRPARLLEPPGVERPSRGHGSHDRRGRADGPELQHGRGRLVDERARPRRRLRHLYHRQQLPRQRARLERHHPRRDRRAGLWPHRRARSDHRGVLSAPGRSQRRGDLPPRAGPDGPHRPLLQDPERLGGRRPQQLRRGERLERRSLGPELRESAGPESVPGSRRRPDPRRRRPLRHRGRQPLHGGRHHRLRRQLRRSPER